MPATKSREQLLTQDQLRCYLHGRHSGKRGDGMSRSLVASVFGFALAVGTSSTFAWEGALNGGGASVTIDAGGDVIAAGDGGDVSGNPSGLSLRVVKYAGAIGAKLWEVYFPDASPSNFRYGFDPASSHHMLAHDAGGDLLLAGAGGPNDFGTLLKLAGGTGAALATRRLGWVLVRHARDHRRRGGESGCGRRCFRRGILRLHCHEGGE